MSSTFISSQRAEIIYRLSELLIERQQEILDANQRDMDEARVAGTLAGPLLSRLALNSSKIKTLAEGLKQIADDSFDNVGQLVKATRLADGLELNQVTVPIGVLMVIFESRPDALPQVIFHFLLHSYSALHSCLYSTRLSFEHNTGLSFEHRTHNTEHRFLRNAEKLSKRKGLCKTIVCFVLNRKPKGF